MPAGVNVDIPLQAYFRINTENMGQFERTLIIAEEGADVHYVEGCTAPVYSTDSLHCAVVEIIVKKGAVVRYTTIQNWSHQCLQPGDQARDRPRGRDDGVDRLQPGLQADHEVPADLPARPQAHGEILSIAFAGNGQHQDAGGKVIHGAPYTTSSIFAKSISKDGGRGTYRGLLEIAKGATEARSNVVCDALLLDEQSRSDTYPTSHRRERRQRGPRGFGVEDRRGAALLSQDHGLDEEEAAKMIVNGFIEPIIKELPMEYAVEMNRLIQLQMEGSIG